MKSKFHAADLALIIVTLVWGSGFVGTQYALNANMPASLIATMRFGIGSLSVFAIFFKKILELKKEELLVGAIAGTFLFIAFVCQTIGQSLSNISSSAFITAIYVIIVPFIVWIATKKRPKSLFCVYYFYWCICFNF